MAVSALDLIKCSVDFQQSHFQRVLLDCRVQEFYSPKSDRSTW